MVESLTQNVTAPTYALDESMPYFRLIGRVGNPNITIRILGYAHSRTKTTAILLQVCKKSRGLVKNQRGAIEHETVLVLRTRMTDHILERPPVHDQVYPLPAHINYNKFIVGVMEKNWSFQFLFSDKTMSNFDISGI